MNALTDLEEGWVEVLGEIYPNLKQLTEDCLKSEDKYYLRHTFISGGKWQEDCKWSKQFDKLIRTEIADVFWHLNQIEGCEVSTDNVSIGFIMLQSYEAEQEINWHRDSLNCQGCYGASIALVGEGTWTRTANGVHKVKEGNTLIFKNVEHATPTTKQTRMTIVMFIYT